jgi:hypothetical protein
LETEGEALKSRSDTDKKGTVTIYQLNKLFGLVIFFLFLPIASCFLRTFNLKPPLMMKPLLLLSFFLLSSRAMLSQQSEGLDSHDNYITTYNQVVRIPLRIKNNSDKVQFYVIRKVKGELGDTQKGYFCLNNNCLDAAIGEFSKRIEAGETLYDLYYTIESGIQTAQTTLKFEYFPKGNLHSIVERNFNVVVEEKQSKAYVFQSREITMQDIYPNPVQDQAFIEYRLHSESVKAKISIHNILGKNMGDYDLPPSETRVRIEAEGLVSGVYFYTLYLDNNGIVTRKLIVRK